MNNVEFDPVEHRKAIARAHGVAAWVLSAEALYEDGNVSPRKHVHDEACYGTLDHADELLCGYDDTSLPYVHCCDECDYNDEQETKRPSHNGGCS